MDDNSPDIRVLIIAGDLLARAGLAAILSEQDGNIVVGQLAPDEHLSESIDVFQPDVLLWDLGWESSEQLDLIDGLQESNYPVVALIQDESNVAEAWADGVRVLLERDSSPQVLTLGISAAIQDMIMVSPQFANALQGREVRPVSPSESLLTPRESEVLRHLGEGMSNKSIAYEMSISEHTVKFHVNSVMSKLNAQSRTEAVVNATRMGLLPL